MLEKKLFTMYEKPKKILNHTKDFTKNWTKTYVLFAIAKCLRVWQDQASLRLSLTLRVASSDSIRPRGLGNRGDGLFLEKEGLGSQSEQGQRSHGVM